MRSLYECTKKDDKAKIWPTEEEIAMIQQEKIVLLRLVGATSETGEPLVFISQSHCKKKKKHKVQVAIDEKRKMTTSVAMK